VSTVELPSELVLGDFVDAVTAMRAVAVESDAEAVTTIVDASAVRRIDGAGLQWLLACLGASEESSGAKALARLRSSPAVDEALRVAGAEERIAEHRVT